MEYRARVSLHENGILGTTTIYYSLDRSLGYKVMDPPGQLWLLFCGRELMEEPARWEHTVLICHI